MFSKLGLALLTTSTLVSGLDLRSDRRNRLAKRDASNDLVLEPVTYASMVQKRQANPFQPDHELDMEYVDMESYNATDKDTFGATVHIQTSDPAVQTEQFGNAVTGVQCSNNNSMAITFASSDLADQAKSVWTAPSMTIITRTPGCNAANERVPWNLTNFQFNGQQVTMAAQKMNWTTASTSVSVDFGSRGNITNPDAVQTGSTLSKRDYSHSFSLAANNKVIFVDPKVGLTELCKACSFNGTVSLKTGALSAGNATLSSSDGSAASSAASSEASSAASVPSSAGNVVKSVVSDAAAAVETKAKSIGSSIDNGLHHLGSSIEHLFVRDEHESSLPKRSLLGDIESHLSKANLELELTGFGGSFLFESSLNAPFFVFPLAGPDGIGLPGLSILDIVTIGPSINPDLIFALELAKPLTFDYGFEFRIPDGAGLVLDLLHPEETSGLVGFSQTSFHALPFTTDFSNLTAAVNASVAFRPSFDIGVEFLGAHINPFALDLQAPKFEINAALDRDVDPDTCEAPASGSNAAGNLVDAVSLDTSFEFEIGIGADISLPEITDIHFHPTKVLYATSDIFPLSTCIPFHTVNGPFSGSNYTGAAAAATSAFIPALATTAAGAASAIATDASVSVGSGVGSVISAFGTVAAASSNDVTLLPASTSVAVASEASATALVTPAPSASA